MKLPLVVTMSNGDTYSVAAGPKAISAAEKAYGFTVSHASVNGISVESMAYMAWAQAAREEKFLGPWKEFWEQLDDIEVSSADPTQ